MKTILLIAAVTLVIYIMLSARVYKDLNDKIYKDEEPSDKI